MENENQDKGDQADIEPLGSAIRLEKDMPLEWQHFESEQFRATAERFNRDAEQVLKTVLSLDDLHSEHHEESAKEDSQIAMLEHKIDILNDLLSYLLAQQVKQPDVRKVQMNATDILWQEQHMDVPTLGQYIVIRLYLADNYPRPLELLGECTDVSPEAGVIKIQCKFYGLNAAVSDLLEKLVFRAHRRDIARQKPV